MNIGDYGVPWCGNRMLGYDTPQWKGSRRLAITWKPNEPWKESLRIVGLERGRSAAHLIVASADDPEDIRGQMFLVDLVEAMPHVAAGGTFTGTWRVRKRGQNYGICLVEASC